MKCANCGAPLDRENRFCPYCGNALETAENAQNSKQEIHIHYHQEQPAETKVKYVYVPAERKSTRSRLVALVLCVILGVFGAHRFYVGKIGTGLLYLFTWGLFGIGWLADVIILLLGKPCDKRGDRLTWT